VRLPDSALLGAEGEAFGIVDHAADIAVTAQCAEAIGLMQRLLDDTVAFTKQRRQFGQPIAGFQALQHRMVDMFVQLEMAQAATYLATLNLDADPVERARAASAAKVTVGQACRYVGQNAIQLHGGMGMTEETPVTLGFRRLTVIENELGSVDHHLARFGALPAA
jgi:alkylation response protein AidB-like acyl-CoA dehydrogenase